MPGPEQLLTFIKCESAARLEAVLHKTFAGSSQVPISKLIRSVHSGRTVLTMLSGKEYIIEVSIRLGPPSIGNCDENANKTVKGPGPFRPDIRAADMIVSGHKMSMGARS